MNNRLFQFAPKSFGKKSKADLDRQIERIHSSVGGKLPAALLRFLKSFHGASVTFEKEVVYRPSVASPWACKVQGTQPLDFLFGLVDKKYGLLAQFECYRDRLASGIVPIAEGPAGNLICQVVSGVGRGGVYFWDHEHPKDDVHDRFCGMYKIADSYSRFVNLLFEEAQEPLDDEGDDGIVSVWLADDLM